MENRKELIQKIFNGFLKDLRDSYFPLTELEEKIYFLDTIYELIREVRTDYNFEFDIPNFVNQKLLSKFRSKMKPFTASFMEVYFCQAEDCQKLVFRKLKIPNEIPFLNDEEFERMLESYAGAIRIVQKSIYVSDQPEPIKLEFSDTQPVFNEEPASKIPGFTRSRQALMMFYLLKTQGIVKNVVTVTDMARFAHVLVGWSYTEIGNTELYKRLKEAHNIKETKTLLSDLEFVKIQFGIIGHKEVIKLIDEQIAELSKT
jgi:hypothetical protein